MRRRIISVALLVAIVGALLAAPAAAAPQAVGRVQDRNGATYTVYEERRPGDPNLYRYYVEDGALGGSRSLNLYRRQSGMETAAVIAVTLLFASSVMAVLRRRSVLGLVTG